MPAVRILSYELHLEGDLGGGGATLEARVLEPGLALCKVVVRGAKAGELLKISFEFPAVGIQGCWNTAAGREKGIATPWSPGFTSKSTSQAPVFCLFGADDSNRLCLACSETLHPISMQANYIEETAGMRCELRFDPRPVPGEETYQFEMRLDQRPLPYARVLDAVRLWWEEMPLCRPCAVPEWGRLPMYSTWYSFHQNVDPQGVLAQCRLAKELGCEAVIVDDGWQTLDSKRGYAFCGDWKPERLPDMAGLVTEVHRLGMKFMLWYSVPFAGKHSQAFSRFQGKFLDLDESLGAAVLDPRFAEVREYLIGTYEQALRDWDLDGLKLDFVDSFNLARGAADQGGQGRDMESVALAVDRLLAEAIRRLQALKPDFCIEFRQSYIGPSMRRYGNLFRAGDCPGDASGNRWRTLDIRLLCGASAAHSDMLVWHAQEPVESAALQVLNILFSVPQISVLLDQVPEAHRRMLQFWLGFWRRHQDLLLGGSLEPAQPDLLFPWVRVSNVKQRLLAIYSSPLAQPGPAVPAELLLVNGTSHRCLVLDLAEDLGRRRLRVWDCQGQGMADEDRDFGRGAHRLEVPPSGLAIVSRDE